jgi:bifunctional DNase/RNase
MSPRSLPPRPSLEHLQKQAKALLKAHKAGDQGVATRFRESFPPLSKATDAEVLVSKVSLRHAQAVIAVEYGFDSWKALREHVARQENGGTAEVKIEGIRSSITNNQKVVVLRKKDSNRYLPIWIGTADSESIALKLQGISLPRPMTHDLLEGTIADLGATVKKVVVSDLRGDTFYATIVLQINGNTVEKDSRPSDAIALAVRTGAPIFVSEVVLDKAGVLIGDAKSPVFSSKHTEKLGWVRGILSDRARNVIFDAQMQARRLNHDAISSEHLLLGLVDDAEGVGAKVLTKLGLDLDEVRSAIKAILRPAEGSPGEETALTPRASRILELAGNEANRLGHYFFGTQHILIGLIREGSGVAAGLLKERGVTLPKAQAEAVRIVEEQQGREP